MADQTNPTPATPIDPAPASAPAEPPAPPPAVGSAEQPSSGAPATPEAAKSPEAPKVVEPPEAPTLLGDKAPAPPPKTDEAKPAEQAPAEPAAPEAAPAEPVKYEAFNLPDNFVPDPKGMEEFTSILGESRGSQELGQKLVDLYVREAAKMQQAAYDAFSKTVETWSNEAKADPEIGGNRLETNLRQAGSVIERFGSQALRDVFNLTGVGNHPEMIRFLSKVGAFMAEPNPVPATKAPAPPKTRAAKRYGAPT